MSPSSGYAVQCSRERSHTINIKKAIFAKPRRSGNWKIINRPDVKRGYRNTNLHPYTSDFSDRIAVFQGVYT